ncbi:NDR1/HIN1-like protein 26 [Andrographis paniculata]|uniref:NDR1/HIN1-like protein 26 n=1 Tax=Andrographis paniculata TaxID=175694 RepID=UPI0021E96D0A|nr:NDR1/HIN1-like protein 26 [Andrographis paniculata]
MNNNIIPTSPKSADGGQLPPDSKQLQRLKAPYRFPDVILWKLFVILFFVIFAVLLLLMFWLSAQPKKLRFSVVRATIDGGGGGGYNLTGGGDRLSTGDLRLVLRAENPNRLVSFYYDKINATICYGNETLSGGKNLPPFRQQRRNVTDLELRSAARDLRVEKAPGDAVFDVKLFAGIRWKIGPFKLRRSCRIRCLSVRVPFGSSKKSFNEVHCHVYTDD